MTKDVKKHEFLLPFPRMFSREDEDPFDAIPFQSSEWYGDEASPALAAPTTWSADAIGLIAEAACANVPGDLRANEENTVPSWLWRHQARGSRREAEADLRDILNRAVGSATAKAWRLGFFTTEKHARAYFDELRFALIHRHIVIAPQLLASWGLSWAYGIEEKPSSRKAFQQRHETPLSNATIDTLISEAKPATASNLWKKIFGSASELKSTTLRLSDIAADWHTATPSPAQTSVNLLALRHYDGSIDLEAVKHTARMLAILLDFQDAGDVTINVGNLAPLLMALGLPYDSEAGRSMAASLAALVTAEGIAASAEMAALRGMSPAFVENREAVMRSLRNHCRAIYGDGNDYEKLSVLPAPLPLKNCPDLSLVAEAQRRWDDALEMARTFGLRALQVTDLTPSRTLAMLMESSAQGLEPIARLTAIRTEGDEGPRQILHPAVNEAFTRLCYTRPVASSAAQHIAGSCTLRKSPGVNPARLKACGLDDVALEKIEAYLPCVNRLRLAITPWIIGIDFCRNKLGISQETLEAPAFDLLKHLGFSDQDVEQADLYCYGYGTARNAKAVPIRQRPIFGCGDEVSNEARIRMAAAVQSFISGDTGLSIRVPASQCVELGGEATLAAWSRGLKSLTVIADPAMVAKPVVKTSARVIKVGATPMVKRLASIHKPMLRKTAPVIVAKKMSSARRTAR